MDVYLRQIRRLTAYLFLFATAMVVVLVNLPGVDHGHRGSIYALLVLAAATGVGVWVFPWHRYGPNLFLVVGVSADAMIALLVYLTGGASSIFFPLYAFVVVISGAYYAARPLIFITAVSCIAAASYLGYAGPVTLGLAIPLLALLPILAAVAIICHVMYRGLERNMENAARRARLVEALHEIDLAILDEGNEAAVLDLAIERTKDLLGCDEARIVLASSDVGPGDHPEESPIRPGTSALDVPLVARGEGVGQLCLRWRGGRPGTEVETLARNFASQIAIAIQDVRLRRQAEQVRALTELTRLKDEFIATASHELRTPLTAILGFSELLVRGRVGAAAQADVFTRIHRSAGQLSRLVDDLLDVSRLDSGRLRLSRETADLSALARQVAAEMAAASPRHAIEIELPETPVYARIDEKRIHQVIANLVSNAVRYSPPGGTVTIAVGPGPNGARVSVRDQGIGIPREALSRVFEKFYRAPNATQAAEATGLGLSVCRGLVEAHGGQIWAESEGPGRGSRFTFTLPVTDDGMER